VRDELARVVGQRSGADPHLQLLDGLEVYGPADHDRVPLPDGLHPDPAGHELIGERFARLAFHSGGPFDRG
jgi:lysophospholipase L1-like esterase